MGALCAEEKGVMVQSSSQLNCGLTDCPNAENRDPAFISSYPVHWILSTTEDAIL